MIIRKSNFVSICLLALASSIALTEYLVYSPSVLPESIDENLFEKDESSTESIDENIDSEEKLVTPNLENSENQSDLIKENQIEKQSTETQDEIAEGSEPFKNSNEHKTVIRSGDTIASVLGNLGFDKTDIYLASKSLTKIFNLRNLKPGQELIVKGKKDENGDITLNGIEFKPDYKYKISVTRTETGFSSEKIDIPVKKVVRNISGIISPKSPDYSLKQCGVKPQIARDALRAISQIANIKTSKTPVDFEFLYEDFYDDEGNSVGKPKLMYAAILLNGKICRIYKFKDNNGINDYVDSGGVILTTLAKSRSMLIQPINSMKVTSKFGIRKHPISGRVKGHTGVDLSANVGTPIKAAASGVITRSSYYSGYGRYISISHSNNIKTAYGHLSRITVRSGQHVKQGQIIGYTGNSGYSTGAHLHYEVIKNGKFINPLLFVKQEPQKLTGEKLLRFNQFKKEVNLQLVGLTQSSGKHFAGKFKKLS